MDKIRLQTLCDDITARTQPSSNKWMRNICTLVSLLSNTTPIRRNDYSTVILKKSHRLFIFYKLRKRRRSRKSIKRSFQEYCRDNVTNIYIQTRIHSAEYINSKNIENTPRRTEWMTYNAKQCLQVVVAKQRRMLPNDVMFRKTKMFK